MVVRREQERETGSFETRHRGLRIRRNLEPEASSTSALPQRLETERLPCLTTGTPQAAVRSAVPVEMLRLPEHHRRADDVDSAQLRGQVGPARQAPHRLREAAHFIGHQALGRERSEHRPRHRGRQLRVVR